MRTPTRLVGHSISAFSLSLLLVLPIMHPTATVAYGEEIQFERIQLSDAFFSEGGTHGDFDDDGHEDVAVGPFIYWGPSFTEQTRFYAGDSYQPLGYSENFLMYSDDVDGDGDQDVIVIGFPGKESWWYENPGDSRASSDRVRATESLWSAHVILEKVDNESPGMVDVDGDGKLDLVCSSGGKYLFASRADQRVREPWRTTEVSPNNGYQRFTHGLGVGDVNNDGEQDILEKDGWWQNPGSSGSNNPWTFHAFPFSSGGAQMYAVDLNGDGRNEVLTSLVAHGYGLAYYRATNDEATEFERVDIMTDSAETSPVGLAVSQLHAVAVADINLDGVPDIVTGKRWWAHANKDDGNTGPATLLWLETQRRGDRVQFIPHVIDNSSGVGTQITVGDVNGDGLPDIVAGTKRGAHLFLQRPVGMAESEQLVSAQAELDKFDQRPAQQIVRHGDVLLPAVNHRVLNFDFEAGLGDSGKIRDWEIRGPIATKALKKRTGSEAATGNLGQFYIDTKVGLPRAIGELISRPFKLQGSTLSCYLGVEGRANDVFFEIVAEQSGQALANWNGEAENTSEMQRVEFNIEPWRGQLVRIRLVDHSESASIQLDQIQMHE